MRRNPCIIISRDQAPCAPIGRARAAPVKRVLDKSYGPPHRLAADLLRPGAGADRVHQKSGEGGPPGVVVASIPVAGLGLVNEKPSTGRTNCTCSRKNSMSATSVSGWGE